MLENDVWAYVDYVLIDFSIHLNDTLIRKDDSM